VATPRITDLGVDDIKTIERLRAPSAIVEMRGSAAVAIDAYGRIIAGPSTDHAAVIQAAIDSLKSVGGTVLIKRGTYTVSRTITQWPAVHVVGEQGAVIYYTGSDYAWQVPPSPTPSWSPGGTANLAFLENLVIRGTASSEGVSIDSAVFRLAMRNVIIDRHGAGGLDLLNVVGCAFHNVWVLNSDHGAKLDMSPTKGGSSNANAFFNCHFQGNRRGVHLTEKSEQNYFFGCIIEGNSVEGVLIEGSHLNHLDGCWFEANTTYDIHIKLGPSGIYPSYNVFANCFARSSGYTNFFDEGSTRTKLIGCMIRMGQWGPSSAGINRPLLLFCDFDNLPTFQNTLEPVVLYCIVAGNPTTRTGSATINAGSTSVTVTHNLPDTPRRVIVTPRGNMGAIWVTNVTSTSFTINVATAPSTNTQVDWYASVW
jgi:hypothetical protein